MKITIIIPVYKAEKYLERCVKSVIHQTYKNLEIILVDDGSPDRCGEICEDFAQKDNRIVAIHKKNAGLCAARNSGMQIMTGSYFYFVDADDYIDNKTIQILQERAQKTNADVIVSNMKVLKYEHQEQRVFEYRKTTLTKEDMLATQDRYEYFYSPGYGNTAWNKLYKTQFIRSLQLTFDENVHISEDYLFNIKCFVHFPKIELVNEYTYYYCNYASTITKSEITDLAEQTMYIMKELHDFFSKNEILNENHDLLAYGVFGSISQTCRNCYFHSKNKFPDVKNQIKKFKESPIATRYLKELAKGKYLKGIPRKDWKFFATLFSILFGLHLYSLATLLWIMLFKLKP